jgi:hypothetical protein
MSHIVSGPRTLGSSSALAPPCSGCAGGGAGAAEGGACAGGGAEALEGFLWMGTRSGISSSVAEALGADTLEGLEADLRAVLGRW